MDERIESAEDCERWAQYLYGSSGVELGRASGVVHVAAVWAEGGDALQVLRADASAPRSLADAVALGLARARADAIVTTGKILRDEPTLTHALAPAFAGWRHEVLCLRGVARSVVMTRGGGTRSIDFAHPIFASPRVTVVTSRDASSGLAERLAAAGKLASRVEIVARPRPSLRDTIAWLRSARGAATVLVEAGPSTSLALYEAPCAVDELLLSVYEGTPPRSAPGGAFLSIDGIAATFPEDTGQHTEQERQEASGRWTFYRHRGV